MPVTLRLGIQAIVFLLFQNHLQAQATPRAVTVAALVAIQVDAMLAESVASVAVVVLNQSGRTISTVIVHLEIVDAAVEEDLDGAFLGASVI